MRNAIRRLTKNRFIQSVAAVAGGTAAAQAIGVGFSPIITRLYGPEAFGALGVFNAAIAIATPVVTLSYAQAIAMPADDEDAVQIGIRSLEIGLVLSAFLLPVLLLFRVEIAGALGFVELASYLWILAPLSFVVAAEQVLMQWLIRKRRFRAMATVQVSQATALGMAKTGLGMLHPTAAILVVVAAMGRIGRAAMLLLGGRGTYERRTDRSVVGKAARERRRAVTKTFRDFPTFRAPQNFLNAISRDLPTLLFSGFFGPAAAGFYAIGQRVLQLPLRLVSQSVGKVLLPRFAEAVQNGRPIRPLIFKSTAGLTAIGIVPFAVVFFFGPGLFAFVFGPEWREAGVYARWLVPWLFFGFINVPSVQALPFSQSQGFLLLWEIVTTGIKVAVIMIGGLFLDNIILTIKVYSLFGAAMYIVLILEGYRRADMNDRVRAL